MIPSRSTHSGWLVDVDNQCHSGLLCPLENLEDTGQATRAGLLGEDVGPGILQVHRAEDQGLHLLSGEADKTGKGKLVVVVQFGKPVVEVVEVHLLGWVISSDFGKMDVDKSDFV
jgi:hypothetical protein